MKKSLIALAALSAFATAAQAQSSVSVYGTLDVGYGETKASVSGTEKSNFSRKTTTTGNGDGGLSTSVIGFRGSEDLGGGNKANFHLEYDLMDAGSGGQATTTAPSAATTSGFGTRLSWVGLESKDKGQVRFGRQATASHGIITSFVAGMANNTVGSVYSAGTSGSTAETNSNASSTTPFSIMPNEASIRPHQVFVNRLITYISPNVNGFVGTVQYGQNATDVQPGVGYTADAVGATGNKTLISDKTKATFTDISLRYTQGKLDLGASRQQNKLTSSATAGAISEGNVNTVWGTSANNFSFLTIDGAAQTFANAKATTTMYGASYNFGVVQPFALYTEKKMEAGQTNATFQAKQKATELGLRAPLTSAIMVFASMYDGDLKSTNNVGVESKADLSGYQLGATYSLSKRTTAYAITGKQEIKSANIGSTAKGKVEGTSIGIRHSF